MNAIKYSLVITLALLFFSCTKEKSYFMRYVVTCLHCETLYKDQFGHEQLTPVNISWSYSFKAVEGDLVWVSAYNLPPISTTFPLRVEIFKDGQSFMVATAKNPFEVVVATGLVK